MSTLEKRVSTVTEIAQASDDLSIYIQSDLCKPAQGAGYNNSAAWSFIVALIAINLLCLYRSLSGYFLADDFIHIAYLTNVCNGHLEALLANFTGNWMQTQGTQFYRPFISLTLALDYLIGGGQPLIFHL